jgi:hypothetical protein
MRLSLSSFQHRVVCKMYNDFEIVYLSPHGLVIRIAGRVDTAVETNEGVIWIT